MTSAIGASALPELVLKTTAPRAPRHLLLRPRLSLDDEAFRDRQVVVVQAPPGFGKTSLLAQWRREILARGAAVAWISADEQSDPERFLQSLVYAVRSGCGRPAFGRILIEGAGASASEFEGVTAWLAEVAQTSLDLVLMVDEAERLPPGAFAILSYLLHNAPANLRLVVASRSGLDHEVADLCAYGYCLLIGAESLRFRLDETLNLVRNRFGTKVDTDTCARIHETVEGWPLGLQLAFAALERGSDARAVVEAMSARGGNLQEQLLSGLLANLSADDAGFLTRIAILDMLHPDLCAALTGQADAAERIARLMRDIPVFVAADDSEWCRLHTLARDAMRARLAEWPADERVELNLRAMRWLEQHGMLEKAARHALAAGHRDAAYDLAEHCLYDAVMQGQLGMVLEWVELLPEAELDRRPRLRLAAAWVLAVSERHDEAERLVEHILAAPDVDALLRYECALIASGAAYYADEPDRFIALFEPWADAPPTREPRLLQMHANRLAALAILRGDPALARRHEQQAPRAEYDGTPAYAARWGEFITALSYLWEGQLRLAADVLRPALAMTDESLGRRHPLTCMFAALLATVAYESDCVDEAAALLANRLDVLERTGTPETALLAYRTAARIAAAQGIEHRALDLLETLFAIGATRNMPRLCIVSLAEQVRMHAGRFRSETCRALAQRIDEILAREEGTRGPVWKRMVELQRATAHANAAIAAQDWRAAHAALECATPFAEGLKLGRAAIENMALRAYVLDRNSLHGRELMREALDLAHTYGLARVFVDAHPAIADWARSLSLDEAGHPEPGRSIAVARVLRPAAPQAPRDANAPRALPSMVLTPKEREVLELLARNLSNKEVAQAMGVGEETVKWHLKNLFGKLDAANRKHVVRRAQLLGLLEGGE
ncbi:MAG TPA: LuxR C-terminal-related transcriptional regulator [Aromatoleum sp.]|uniref:LuxR C-terminal-related transcriptional regulator n=1 Tax=Aromatoleum sp. TaxID=2307007 RepID=UPI002B497C7B|nr:LuxR C-terminal-related transcriptional regulator [Aromatoleum sp.]HJV25196.1 LuxR C-terminal-related transcriptional regulator [Aromatoleum sp.]